MFLVMAFIFALLCYGMRKADLSYDDSFVGLVERIIRFGLRLAVLICLLGFVLL
jgi:hypothetical protein